MFLGVLCSFLKTEQQRPKRQILHLQSTDLVFNVYFKREAGNDVPVRGDVKCRPTAEHVDRVQATSFSVVLSLSV